MFEKQMVSIEMKQYESLVRDSVTLAALKALLKARAAGYAGITYNEVEMFAQMFCMGEQAQEGTGK